MPKPKFISLFSGCGGLDLGFIKAGFKPIAAYDNWPLAIENYRRNIGDHAVLWDLALGRLPTDVSCDIVLAGSPCQGFSTVGKRRLDDPRNDLLHAAVEIAIRANPKVAVFENVPGILQGNHKKHWEQACRQLMSAGYTTSTMVIDARDTGIPQARKRVVLIAGKVNYDFKSSIRIHHAPTLAEAIADVHGLVNHEPKIVAKGSHEMKIAARILPGQKLCNVRAGEASIHTWEIPDVYGEVTASERQLLEAVMRLRRRFRLRNFGDADPVTIALLEKELKRGVVREVNRLIKKEYLRWIGTSVDLTNTFNGKYRRAHPRGASYTVDTRFGDPRHFLHPFENRGFSVREAARIQGFPDEYIFYGSINDQFKLVGNAVPPTMGFVIGEMIRGVLKGEKHGSY